MALAKAVISWRRVLLSGDRCDEADVVALAAVVAEVVALKTSSWGGGFYHGLIKR